MSKPKGNKTVRRILVSTVLVCMIFLVLVTGTAEARYRAEKDVEVMFQVEEPAQIYLGTLTEVKTETDGETTEALEKNVTFDPEGIPAWNQKDGKCWMELAVANGSSEVQFCEEDQKFRILLIGTLGLGPLEAFPQIKLHVPLKEDPDKTEVFGAKLTRIREGSELYHSVGAGWIIQFQNEDGQEPWWLLEGNAFLYKHFIITMENVLAESDMLLQPQVEAKVVKD